MASKSYRPGPQQRCSPASGLYAAERRSDPVVLTGVPEGSVPLDLAADGRWLR